MDKQALIKVVKDYPIVTISINRPEHKNAVDGACADALASAFRDFDSDPQAMVAVLCGEGGTFCAGADCKLKFTRVVESR